MGEYKSQIMKQDCYFNLSRLSIQSSDLQDGGESHLQQDNLRFSDAGLMESKSAPVITYKPDSDKSGHLGDFLSRPVAINTFSWVEGSATQVQNQFYPWQLFVNTTSIKNKLQNYARIRGKLKLKFVVNASPFYYGALRVCYCPMIPGTMDFSNSQGDQIKFSQMPGDFLYPADMTSFEMECPFLWPHSWVNLQSNLNFATLGRINYILYSVLQSANGVPATNVTVTCYAWMEDAELAGLTSGLILQSDEYDSAGPISGPASTVANIAGKLSNVPFVGTLARATEIGAKAIGGIASLFGFSNPPVIDDVMPFQPKSFHAFSNVETSVPIDKLSIDPKNEITVDKRVIGIEQDDELTIVNFAGKQSWITGSLWTEAYAPGTQIMCFPVTPRLFSSLAGTSQNFINETPACHAAAAFEQWRGEMIFTLKFVKSRYHTGRVQISWDPQGIPGTNAETTTMTRIVDLQVETEVEFAIPYKAYTPWLSTSNVANTWTITTGAPAWSYNPGNFNGAVKVVVLNELTGPAASQSIDVLLFARTGKDFRLSVPNALPDFSVYTVQSLQLSDVGTELQEDDTLAITVGENVLSLRQLLHRSTLWHVAPLGNPLSAAATYNTTNLYFHTNYIPRYPLEPGFSTQALNFGVGLISGSRTPYQFSPNTFLNWFGNCFAGYRGSLVHHFNVIGNGAALLDDFKIERDPIYWILDSTRLASNRFSVGANTADASSLSRVPTSASFNVKRTVIGTRGMSLTNTNTQSALSVVTPQYSKWKFRPSYGPSRAGAVAAALTEIDSLKISAMGRCGSTSSGADQGWPILETYVAGGVDFDLLFFICVPTLYEFVSVTADNTF
jgi:hypothetical protein